MQRELGFQKQALGMQAPKLNAAPLQVISEETPKAVTPSPVDLHWKR